MLAETAILSDAVATAIGNLILDLADIPRGIERAQRIHGVQGIVIIKDEKMGLWGNIKLCSIDTGS